MRFPYLSGSSDMANEPVITGCKKVMMTGLASIRNEEFMTLFSLTFSLDPLINH